MAAEGSINRRIAVQVGLGKKQDSVLKITKCKKSWWYGSSGRALPYQM
jgi:hypothetical protein